jgi:collagenase-like PrtC family protease
MLPDPEGYWVYYENYAAAIMAAEASRNLIKQLKDQLAAREAELEVFRNPDKFPHGFAELCFVSGYKKGLKDAAKGMTP